MNWAFFIEKQQQQQYAITTTTKQKIKPNQTNKQTVEKTETAKTFRFNEMTYLRNINICIFFSDHKPPGGGCCQIWAIVCATVKGMVFKQFTLGKAQSKSESLGLE